MGYVIEEKNGEYKVLLSLMKDGYSLRQIKTYLYTFNRNGISNHEALKILYENSLPKLKEVKENSRAILKNIDGSISILKPIATYTKDSNSLFPDTFIICSSCRKNNAVNVLSSNDIKSLYKSACIMKRNDITISLIRFCRRIRVSIFAKEDLSSEGIETIKNEYNIIKYKKLLKIKEKELI